MNSPSPDLDHLEDLAARGELSSNIVGFCRFLRGRGAGVGPAEEADALRALDRSGVADPARFRAALRVCLAKSTGEQAIFDDEFDRYWNVWDRAAELGQPPPDERREPERGNDGDAQAPPRASAQGPAIVEWLQRGAQAGDEEETAGYSPVEVLTKRDFRGFGIEELSDLERSVKLIARILAKRFRRRYCYSRSGGKLDLRRTLRRNLRRGGEMMEISYRRRRRQRLKLVLLCDVSRSMDLYSRFFVQFIYAFQAACRRIETFAFSTSLRRITEALSEDDFEVVLDRLARDVPQWSGGTRIGACLDTFLKSRGDAVLDRRTVVLILSDGWDTGDIELLTASMRDIRRRAQCVIWLNPLVGYEGYSPDTAGMEAALPYVDLFASAHNIASLRQLAESLGQLRGRSHGWRGRRNRVAAKQDKGEWSVESRDGDTMSGEDIPTSARNLAALAQELQEKRASRTNSE